MLEITPIISEARKHEFKLLKQAKETANSYLLVYCRMLWETINNSENNVTYTTQNKCSCPGGGGIFISIT